MIAFAFAVFFMIATPGPAVLALAGVGAAYSFKVGLKFLIGLTIGYLSVWALVITGFASVIFSIPVMRTIFLFIASGYLVYLSLKIMFRGSILLTGFAVFPDNFVLETTWKFIVMNLIWIPLHVAWLALGSTIEKVNLKPSTQKYINIIMGASLLVVAVLSFLSMTKI